MNEIRVIFNPYANRGRGHLRTRQQLVNALEQIKCPFSLVETTAKGDAKRLAAEAVAQGIHIVAAAGGDGTIHEVVNGLMTAAEGQPLPKLAIFPIGTANDLAEALSLSRQMGSTADAILQERTRQIDVGLVTYGSANGTEHQYFTNNVGIGLEAFVAQKADKIKRLRGPLLYLVAALQSLWAYRSSEMSVRWEVPDGGWQEIAGPTLMLTVGNGQRAGGGFYLTPDAQLDDRLLDGGLLGDVSKGRLINLLLKARNGDHIHDDAVTTLRSPRIRVMAEQGVPVHADGEILALAATKIDLGVATRQLEVLAPVKQ